MQTDMYITVILTWLLMTGLKHEPSGVAVSDVSVAEVDVGDTRKASVARTQRDRQVSMWRTVGDSSQRNPEQYL